MLLFIDPIVFIVHAYDVKHDTFHERNAHKELSGLKQRTALDRDGEWVCAVVHFTCWPSVPSPVITQWHAQLVSK